MAQSSLLATLTGKLIIQLEYADTIYSWSHWVFKRANVLPLPTLGMLLHGHYIIHTLVQTINRFVKEAIHLQE